MRIAKHMLCLAVTLAPAAALATPGDAAWNEPARYELEYRVELPAVDAGPDAGVRVWVPYPRQHADQKLEEARLRSPWPYELRRDAEGNQVLFLSGKGRPEQPLVMRFSVERRPGGGVPRASIRPSSADDPRRHLGEARLIPFAKVIRDLAEHLARGRRTDNDKIRAFYDYVVKNMRYDKSGSGWGRGDAVWACDHKRGNCTDFHSLFIGMARSQGIPARFVMGVPIPQGVEQGEIAGYHCWAQYYDPARGWVPLDASEAAKSGRADDYFGLLPNDRIEFTLGRDLVLDPPQSGKPLNYFIYPYGEIDGTPVDRIPFAFSFRRLD